MAGQWKSDSARLQIAASGGLFEIGPVRAESVQFPTGCNKQRRGMKVESVILIVLVGLICINAALFLKLRSRQRHIDAQYDGVGRVYRMAMNVPKESGVYRYTVLITRKPRPQVEFPGGGLRMFSDEPVTYIGAETLERLEDKP